MAARGASTARQAGGRAAAHAPELVPGEAGRAARSLDRLIHERTRLGILSALAVSEALTFVELKSLLEASDGNLSVHARKLEEAEYVSCKKGFAGRVPRTEFRITASGRKALEAYLKHMEALIRATRR
jgi:DNA-binding MarR family transcriptional regulator